MLHNSAISIKLETLQTCAETQDPDGKVLLMKRRREVQLCNHEIRLEAVVEDPLLYADIIFGVNNINTSPH